MQNYDPADDRYGSKAGEIIGTMRRTMSAVPPKADIIWIHSRRQLLANAAIAASRVSA
jgi:hypothetical protein